MMPAPRRAGSPRTRPYSGAKTDDQRACRESFFAPYRKMEPITRAYTQTCKPPKTLTMTNLGQCVRDVVFAGDSIMRHVAFFLQCELGRKHHVSYTAFKGHLHERLGAS